MSSKHLLFVLHGMGEHPAGWSTRTGGVVDTLVSASQRYKWFRDRDRSLADYVDFVELRYDDEFERWREKAATAASEVLHAAPAGWMRDVLGKLTAIQPGQADPFAITSALDVALYRLLANVHNAVIAKLSNQVITNLDQKKPSRVSLLTHSLGTSVGHDVFAHIASDGTPQTNPWHWQNEFQLRCYFSVANVSRILQTAPKVLASPVRPGMGQERYVRKFWNFTHAIDPFPIIKRFAPLPDWQADSYVGITMQHLLHPNVHGYTHYLEHPGVHSSIINGLLRGTVIEDPEVVEQIETTLAQKQREALQGIPGFGAKISAVQQIASKLITIGDDAAIEDAVPAFIDMVVDYFTKVAD